MCVGLQPAVGKSAYQLANLLDAVGVDLVRLNRMPQRMVPLRTYPDVPRAEMDRIYLAGQGIDAAVNDRNAAIAAGPVLTVNGCVRLDVAFDDREKALVLLERRRRLHFVRDAELAEDEDERCPRCAHEDVGRYHPLAVWVVLPLLLPFMVLMLVFIPFVPLALRYARRKHWYCGHCGHRWRADPAKELSR